MFLEVVAFSADIGGDFLTIGKANTSDLTERGVRFLGGYRFDLKADTAFLRAAVD